MKQKVFSGVSLSSIIPVTVFKKGENIVEIVIVVIIIQVGHNQEEVVIKDFFPASQRYPMFVLEYVIPTPGPRNQIIQANTLSTG